MSVVQKRGFTIVELLIVIVVIGILVAITIVAYTGIQSRARDNVRRSDLASIQKILAIYKAQNGGYPACSGGLYQPGTATQSCLLNDPDVISALAPAVTQVVPMDPINTGQKVYRYGVGWSFTPPCATVTNLSSNYILGAALDDTSITACPGFWGQSDVNHVVGTKD